MQNYLNVVARQKRFCQVRFYLVSYCRQLLNLSKPHVLDFLIHKQGTIISKRKPIQLRQKFTYN